MANPLPAPLVFTTSSHKQAFVKFLRSRSGKIVCDISWCEVRPSDQDMHELETHLMKVSNCNQKDSFLEENEDERQELIKRILEI